MSKNFLPWLGVGLLAGIALFIIFPTNSGSSSVGSTEKTANVMVKNGVQYVTIDVKGGYKPKVSSIQS